MAAKLLINQPREVSPTLERHAGHSVPLLKPMNRESQVRFIAILLFLLTVAAVVFAGFNLKQENDFQVATDGVWWVERTGRLVAERVDPNGPGAKAGIKAGDQLTAVNGQEVKGMAGLQRQIDRTG